MKAEVYKGVLSYIRDVISGSDFENHCYAVGGCVRDEVMGNEIKDIDLVIDIENGGLRFAEWMSENGHTSGKVVTYRTYGTAMFKLSSYPDIEIECVQTRKEQYKDKESRNPETCFGTLYEDCMRRDLTINSLYYNISSGEVLDMTGNGMKDIKEKRIRVTSTPEIIFSDDPLRIMRVIRFSSRFNWEIEGKTYGGLILNADRLSIITKERIADELNKMLMCDNPVKAIRELVNIGAMKYVIPEFMETVGMTQNKYHSDDVYEHTLKVLEKVSFSSSNFGFLYTEKENLALRMSALLHDIGKIHTRTIDEEGNIHFYRHENAGAGLCEKILRRLKYSNDFIDSVKFLVLNHMRCKQWGDDCKGLKDKTLRKFQYECGDESTFSLLMILIDADNNSHATECCLKKQVGVISMKTSFMMLLGTDMFGYKLPIDGNDVMEVKGIGPGKEVKECLDCALKLAFNNPRITKEELLKHIKGYKLK